MKTLEDKIVTEFRERFVARVEGAKAEILYFPDGIRPDVVESFLKDKLSEVRRQALDEFFIAVDAKYKDYEITKAMGEILVSLKDNRREE